MTLMQLRYFKETCDKGSVTDASSFLHVSVSTISQAIKELEAEFNIELLYRNNRGVAPTKEGELLLGYANEILQLEAHIVKTMREAAGEKTVINLGIPTISCDTIWPLLSKEIYQKCPGIKVNIITTMGNQELLKMLDDNRIDATIMIHPLDKDVASYNTLTLWPCPKLAFVVSEKNKLAKKKEVELKDVVNVNLVRHISDNKDTFLTELYKPYGKKPNFIETCEQLSTMMGMIRNDTAGSYINTEIAKHYDRSRNSSIIIWCGHIKTEGQKVF